jgi:hypothetical protein
MKKNARDTPKKANLPRRLPDHRLKVRFVLRILGFLASLGAAWLSSYLEVARDHAALIIPICVVSAVLCAGSLFVPILFGIRCKSCGQRIRSSRTTQQHDGYAPLHYYCSKCNVEWDTGLVLGSPD